jgi:hypothetical protein
MGGYPRYGGVDMKADADFAGGDAEGIEGGKRKLTSWNRLVMRVMKSRNVSFKQALQIASKMHKKSKSRR